jgi:hypothetical protein
LSEWFCLLLFDSILLTTEKPGDPYWNVGGQRKDPPNHRQLGGTSRRSLFSVRFGEGGRSPKPHRLVKADRREGLVVR